MHVSPQYHPRECILSAQVIVENKNIEMELKYQRS